VTKYHFIHPDGHKSAGWKIQTSRNPACFINPSKKPPSKQEPILVEIFRQDEAMRFHVSSG
jgi:hypothetical protein